MRSARLSEAAKVARTPAPETLLWVDVSVAANGGYAVTWSIRGVPGFVWCKGPAQVRDTVEGIVEDWSQV